MRYVICLLFFCCFNTVAVEWSTLSPEQKKSAQASRR